MNTKQPLPRNWMLFVGASLLLVMLQLTFGIDVDQGPPNKKWWDWLDPVLTIGTFGAALATWLDERRARLLRQTPISVVLIHADSRDKLELPYRPLRGQLSRGELTGVVTMYMKDSIDKSKLRGAFESKNGELPPLDLAISGKVDVVEFEIEAAQFAQVAASLPQLPGPLAAPTDAPHAPPNH